MATSRLQVRSADIVGQEPDQPASALVRDRLAMKRKGLDALDPEALDMAAEILAALHGALCGEMTALAGDRESRYRRHQLLGSAALPLEDLVYLWRRRPLVVATALAPLMEIPEQARGSLADIGGEIAAHAAAFTKHLLLALEEGSITVVEAERLDRDLAVLHVVIGEARDAIAQRALPTRPVENRRRP